MLFFSYFSFRDYYLTKLLLLILLCEMILPISAGLVFKENFENIGQLEDNWEIQGVNWKLSSKYNRSPNGYNSLRLAPTQLGVWQQMWQTVNYSKPFHLRIWFYERGWGNRVKVDQQYLFIGDNKTFDSSKKKCQIGQSGHKDYEGFYVIFDGLNARKSQSISDRERWVTFEFLIDDDGTAMIKIDDSVEITLVEKWETVGSIGLGVFGRKDRGGTTDAYWDHLEIFDTVGIPNLALERKNCLTTTWSKLRMN
jgi:hypothetical protein